RAAGGLGRVELRLRRGDAERLAAVGERRSAVDEKTSGIELRPRAHELPLDHLELSDRPAELPTSFRVADRSAERGASEPQRERARSGRRLGERPRPEVVATGERWKPAALLLVVRRDEQVADAEAVVRRDRERDRSVGRAELLHDQRDGERVEPGATEIRGHRQTQQPELSELGQQLERERAVLAPLLGARGDTSAPEVTHGVANGELIVAVVEVH